MPHIVAHSALQCAGQCASWHSTAFRTVRIFSATHSALAAPRAVPSAVFQRSSGHAARHAALHAVQSAERGVQSRVLRRQQCAVRRRGQYAPQSLVQPRACSEAQSTGTLRNATQCMAWCTLQRRMQHSAAACHTAHRHKCSAPHSAAQCHVVQNSAQHSTQPSTSLTCSPAQMQRPMQHSPEHSMLRSARHIRHTTQRTVCGAWGIVQHAAQTMVQRSAWCYCPDFGK